MKISKEIVAYVKSVMVPVLVGLIPQVHPAQTMVIFVPTMNVTGLVFVCILTTPLPVMTAMPVPQVIPALAVPVQVVPHQIVTTAISVPMTAVTV
jgi:hypothetical protein